MSTETVYMSGAEIGRHFGVGVSAVGNWKVRYPIDHPTYPTPAPDAWMLSGRDRLPLWRADRLPEWEAWRALKKTGGYRRDRDGGAS